LSTIETFGKQFISLVVKLIFKPRHQLWQQWQNDKASIQKILVIRPDERLGNTLLIVPMLSSIRCCFPLAQLDALIGEKFACTLEGNPDLNNIIPFPKRMFARQIWKFLGFMKDIRARKYDLVIDATHMHSFSLNGAIISRFSGAKYSLGFLRGTATRFHNLCQPLPEEKMHEIDYFGKLIEPLGCGRIDSERKIYLSEENYLHAEKFFCDKFKDTQIIIGLNIGARGQKSWGYDKFIKLANKLVRWRESVGVLITWGPAEADRISAFENIHPQIVLCPLLSIKDLAAMYKLCNIMVSGDTGPMHLALAVNTPVVAIFKNDNFWRYGPRTGHYRIIYRENNVPSTEDVFNAVKSLMDEIKDLNPSALI
jgi:ADP-heptose:LPS heptosyltransferase